MKDNMKKIYLFLLAAAGILAVASCAREELLDKTGEVNAPGEVTTLTFSFDATKTALVDGKTTWAAGDKIRVYTHDGTFYRDVEVPEEAVGQSSFSAEVNIKDSVYFAVYPIEASKGIAGGKITVNLPKNPDGRFDSANICVAVARGSEFQMHNVTAVLKVTVSSGNVVEMLQIIAKNAMVGDYAIGYGKKDGKDTLNFTASGTSKSLTVPVGGVDGDYFIPVLPGTYEKGLSVTAMRGNGGYQNDTTAKDNVVKINTLYNLGTIGNNISNGLPGEGTADNPFTISNFAEMSAFANSVTMGKTYEGEIVSLVADITDTPVTAPAGYWLSDDEQGSFGGTFLGNDHTIALNLDGEANCKSQNYVALFGVLDAGAKIQDLKVSGTVKATGTYTAGIVGYIRGENGKKATIKNCSSSATITGGERVSGIAGYATYADITDCENSGVITASRSVGGIVGYMLQGTLENNKNSAAITATTECGGFYKYNAYNNVHWWSLEASSGNGAATSQAASLYGVGGIAGYAQNVNITNCQNDAAITGVGKVGGIAGSYYAGSLKNNVNTADITASGGIAGGIIGWAYTQMSADGDRNSGNIKARAVVGGLYGILNMWGYSSSNSTSTIKNGVNTGKVTATGKVTFTAGGIQPADYSDAGGIVGLLAPSAMSTTRRGIIYLSDCTNSGEVTGPYHAVGGIIGIAWQWSQFSSANTVSNCINTADITGYCRVGGIIGEQYSRWIAQDKITYSNLINTGNVHATITSGTTVSAAGIIGRSHYNSTSTVITPGTFGSVFNNCLNTGDVTYEKDDNAASYAGGIGGYCGLGAFNNVVSFGKVGPKSGAAPAIASGKTTSTHLGAIAGQLGTKYYPVICAYYPSGVSGEGNPAFGSSSNAEAVSSSFAMMYNDEFKFESPIEYEGSSYEDVVSALNAWVAKNGATSFYAWKLVAAGPVLDM